MYRRYSPPRSSGGALAGVFLSIFASVIIIGFGIFLVNLFASEDDKYKGLVEVTATQTKVDCNGLYCPGYDSDPDGCRKCEVNFEYEYGGEKYYGVSFDVRPSQTGQRTVLVDPKNPYVTQERQKDDPAIWILVIFEFLLSGFTIFLAYRYYQWYRLYNKAEEEGRLEELLRDLEDQGVLEREEW